MKVTPPVRFALLFSSSIVDRKFTTIPLTFEVLVLSITENFTTTSLSLFSVLGSSKIELSKTSTATLEPLGTVTLELKLT